MAFPRDALVSLRDFTTDANNQSVCWGNSLITVDMRWAKTSETGEYSWPTREAIWGNAVYH